MITEKDMTRQEMEKRSFDSRCQVCGAGLAVAWGGMWGIESYVLRCSNDPKHDGIERPFAPSPMDIPGYNLPSVESARRKGLEKTLGPVKTNALAQYIGSVQLTKADAEHILTTIWPDAPKVEVFKAAMICQQYGLNPLMKHIFLIKFGNAWTTVTGIKGDRLRAAQQKRFSYTDGPRMMSDKEQQEIMGEISATHFWAICKLRDEYGNTAVGYGNWPKAKEVQGADKGNSKANMCFIHAERQALDRLCPGALPPNVGSIDEAFVDVPTVTVTDRPVRAAIPENTHVNPETGEIPFTREEEITFADPAPAAPVAPAAAAPAPAAPAFAEHKVEPAWLKESLKKLKWNELTAKTWILSTLGSATDCSGSLVETLDRMKDEDRIKFVNEVNNRLKTAG